MTKKMELLQRLIKIEKMIAAKQAGCTKDLSSILHRLKTDDLH